MSRPRIIIADDLTGSCDAGIQFHQIGWTVHVCWCANDLNHSMADLVVYCTNSRDFPVQVAAERVREVCRGFVDRDLSILYKKIDSTLKGNIGVEINIMLDQKVASAAVVAPAFPQMGRRIIEGRLRIDGVSPSSRVDLPAALQRQSSRQIYVINCQQLSQPDFDLRAVLKDRIDDGLKIFVLDAADDETLRKIATICCSIPHVLLVGSAGLAGHLADCLGKRKSNTCVTTEDALDPLKRRRLVVLFVGTTNEVTQRQISALRCTDCIDEINLSNRAVVELRHSFGEHRCALLTIEWHRKDRQSDLRNVIDYLATVGPVGFVLTGGDTAWLVCKAAGSHGILLDGEICLGIPRGRLLGGRLAGTPIVTKAGGFGEEDAIIRAIEKLTRI